MVEAGHRFGHYTIVRQLGAGGMGQVFLARDDRLGRDVALKVLPREFVGDPEQLGRFRREALTLAALNHPNIATIHGFEDDARGGVALVLERVEGESLAERLARGPLGPAEALHVCVQVAEALEVAHERGVVHRDLKPGNVMITPRGLAKVLDFGLAKRTGGLLGRPAGGAEPAAGDAPAGRAPAAPSAPAGAFPVTLHGTVVGTPGYMSPEQVLAGLQDQRTDLFAFGCVLYECLTGRRAFEGRDAFETMAKVLYDAPDLAALPERTPARVRDLVSRCLEKDAERRLGDAKHARHELEEALGIRQALAARAGEAVAVPHNLPAEVSSFVGREAVLAECGALLEGTRLLTLTGMGGSGKTRVAQRLAAGALERFRDGVWFVDLASLQDGARVPEAVAAAAGVREEPGVPVTRTLAEHLRERHALLLLDNCEDVLEGCRQVVGALLAACPHVRLLATCREPLGVAGEIVHAVPPLTPPPEGEARPEALAANECVALFVARAAAANAAFAFGPDNARAIAEICRRLDGIPLALELAAARVRLLSVEEIRARLGDRFKLLSAGGRAAVGRHQTLRATIQWSVDQLHDDERELLRALSVFVGAWTLESAVAVAGADRDEFEVLDALTRLVDKSLVSVGPAAGGTRYRYLESVRLFALELLAAGEEEAAVRERHLAYFLAAAEASAAKLVGAAQSAWLERLDAEHEDVLAAHAFCDRAEGGALRGLRIAAAMWRYWSVRGRYALARRTLRDALARPGSGEPGVERANALVRAGGFALYEGDYAAARPLIEESLAVYRALGDRKGVARGLAGLSVVAMYQQDHATARASGLESAALYEELGEAHGAAIALHNVTSVDLQAGDLAAARAHGERALALLESSGDDRQIGHTLTGLAEAHARLGEPERARERFAAGFERLRPMGGIREVAYALEQVAGWAATRGEAARAARWMGAAEAIRQRIGSPPLPSEAAEYARLRARIEQALGPEAAAGAWAAGGAAGGDAAPAEVLDWLRG